MPAEQRGSTLRTVPAAATTTAKPLWWRAVVIGCAGALWVILVAHPMNIYRTDIGRHIKSGEVILQTGSVPVTNLFSYSAPDYPVPNHHWGAAVLFALVHRWWSFAGLSLLFLIMQGATFLVTFATARRLGGFTAAALLAVAAAPLMASRTEVRPEMFSHFFLAAMIALLVAHAQGRLRPQWLLAIPVMEVLWVNAHIVFPVGVMVAGAFALAALHRWWMERTDPALQNLLWLGGIACATTLAMLVNPLGLEGALYPARIVNLLHGYQLFEMQPTSHMLRMFPPALTFAAFWTVCAIGVAMAWQHRYAQRPMLTVALGGLFAIGTVFGWMALRNLPLAALLLLPAAADAWSSMRPLAWLRARGLGTRSLALLLAIALWFGHAPSYWRGAVTSIGVGLFPGSLDAFEAFHRSGMRGPIFNNYDVGGGLIYGLYPEERVFADNRPEAYPPGFLDGAVLGAQRDESIWQKLLAQHRFQSIFFAWRERTPWTVPFLRRRLADGMWAQIYGDENVIVLRRLKALPDEEDFLPPPPPPTR